MAADRSQVWRLVSRAGLAGGGAPNKDSYLPPLTDTSSVNTWGGWYDSDDGLDEGVPLGCGQGVADGKDRDGAVLLAGAAGVAGRSGLGRAGIFGNGADGVEQFGLVGLQLDQQVVAGVAGCFEGFF